MPVRYEGIYAKFDRLSKTLDAFNKAIDDFLSGDTNGVINDFDSKPNHLIVKAFSHDPPPPEIGVLAGEMLYHLRSILDHMACELTKANKRAVNRKTEYPIFQRPQDRQSHP
jgi:hypothetical protein